MPLVIAVGAAYLLGVPSENRGSFPRTTMTTTTATTRAELEREEQKKPIERAGDYSLFRPEVAGFAEKYLHASLFFSRNGRNATVKQKKRCIFRFLLFCLRFLCLNGAFRRPNMTKCAQKVSFHLLFGFPFSYKFLINIHM